MRYFTLCIGLLQCVFAPAVWGLTGVSPEGVAVRSTGVTSVFLTFQGLSPSEVPAGAFWCGEISVDKNTVTNSNPCVPGTFFGAPPGVRDLSRIGGTAGQRNLTDIMTVPASVARRAFQAAKNLNSVDNTSRFFYVRRFIDSNTQAQSFVAVKCRLSGGGVDSVLALTNVTTRFETQRGERPVDLIAQDSTAPNITAHIRYNGSGVLRGRWEVVKPGDAQPTADDLLPDANFPIEQRGQQRRYTQLGRFTQYLPPTGQIILAGPRPEQIPTSAPGPYLVLLRLEAGSDMNSRSDTGDGVVQGGGIAGFSLPVLRYYVVSPDESGAIQASVDKLTLLSPAANTVLQTEDPLVFKWAHRTNTTSYLVEVFSDNEEIVSAIVGGKSRTYSAPPWIVEQAHAPLRWRVTSYDAMGRRHAKSKWRTVTIAVENRNDETVYPPLQPGY